MRKGETIKGYEILADSVPAGGRGAVSFARKGGEEFFIKVFLSPKYPVEGAPGSAETKRKAKERCSEFERRQTEINKRIADKCGRGGNLIYAVDFFRDGTCYYKVNEKVDNSSLQPEDIAKSSTDDILLLLRTLAHSLQILHREGIVHGDLKPDNILLKRTDAGKFVAKLIDFDDSYFTENPPGCDDIVGTPEYHSPEILKYVQGENDDKNLLTVKSDIFTLGIIFAEYLCGERPTPDAKYKTLAASVAAGHSGKIHGSYKRLSPMMTDLIRSMLKNDTSARPDIGAVLETLKNKDITRMESADTAFGLKVGKGLKSGAGSEHSTSTSGGSKLRIGKGLKPDK